MTYVHRPINCGNIDPILEKQFKMQKVRTQNYFGSYLVCHKLLKISVLIVGSADDLAGPL